jgi:ABC-2 type transport system permease protein
MISPSLRHLLRIYALEAKYECVKQLRLPTQLIFSMGFPLMFYTVFGLLFGRGGGAGSGSFALFYIATYGAFGIVTAAMYGFGVGVATERGQGWMLLKRASPMPYAAYFIGKLAMSLVSAASIVALLTASGVLVMGVRVSPIAWCEMAALLILGVTPFCVLGLVIGYWMGPNSAVAAVNLVSMPMAMLSGLWIPLNVLPAFVRSIARFLPAYHYSQLALATIGQNQPGSIAGHVLALVGFTILCLSLAYAGYRRDEDKTYG